MVDTTSPVAWAGKPYPEIQEIGEQDGSILLAPGGALEQHGHHLPTGTDTILVDVGGLRPAGKREP